VPNVSDSSDASHQVDTKTVTETFNEGSTESSGINNVERVSEKVIEKKSKTKKLEKVDTKKPAQTERNVLEMPQSPISPVFDHGDFSYEEDVMPGKCDPLHEHLV
jgi:hypothetical protein